ncbi:MAG: L-threonylcarbamoyladenylate synthase [Candidatus Pacebacteria bacterium]|nr:L-threonylcarbamoyladenylate synthase [Candidatus Paceibacterota bacterium]
MIKFNKKLIDSIKKSITGGAIGIIPTDTIYGIVCLAMNKKSVERVYKLRKRNPKKPVIILISSIKDLKLFNVKVDKEKKMLELLWPNKISIVLNCPEKKFEYLHRGKKTLAFRMPKDKELLSLLKATGPLIAPSANIEGKKPAQNIKKAQEYFGSNVDFYIDGGNLNSEPSTIISIISGGIKVIRKGLVRI